MWHVLQSECGLDQRLKGAQLHPGPTCGGSPSQLLRYSSSQPYVDQTMPRHGAKTGSSHVCDVVLRKARGEDTTFRTWEDFCGQSQVLGPEDK